VQPGMTTPVALLLIPLPELPSLGGGDGDSDSPDRDAPNADGSPSSAPGGPSASLGLGLGIGGVGGPGGGAPGGGGSGGGGGGASTSGSAGSPGPDASQGGGTPDPGTPQSGDRSPSALDANPSQASEPSASGPGIDAPEAPRRRLSTIGWVLVGSGAAVLAGTAAWDIVLQTGPIEEYSELQDSEVARARELEQDIAAVRPVIGSLYGVGAGLAVAGIVHWALTGGAERAPAVAVAPWLSAHGAGVQIRLGRSRGGVQ
jgi:hypothetical protein